jgi:hypothetical protein
MRAHAFKQPAGGCELSARPGSARGFSHPALGSRPGLAEAPGGRPLHDLPERASTVPDRSPSFGVDFARLRIFPPASSGPFSSCTCGGACETCRGQPATQWERSVALQGAPAAPPPAPTAETEPPAVAQQPEEEFSLYLQRLRTGCLKDGSVTVSLETNANDSNQVTGLLQVRFEGEGRTSYTPENLHEGRLFPVGRVRRAENGKYCFCDCIHYRQYLQGLAWTGPVGGVADQPVAQITSGHRTEQVNGQWYEEDVSTGLHGNVQQVGCQRQFTDTPGVTAGAQVGVPVLLRYNFYLQIWDACQQQELWHDQLALTIGGSTPPRTILWSWQPLPLSRESILADVAGGPTGTEVPAVEVKIVSAPDVRMFDNPMDPLVELTSGTPLPIGTRIRILDDSDPIVHHVEVLDGPLAGQTGYIAALGSYRAETQDQQQR